MKKRISILLLTVLVFLSITPFAMAQTLKFWDVKDNHWAAEAINEMAKRGIISGYSDGSFRPNDPVTRAEFAKIMIAAAGVKMENNNNLKQTFQDVGRNHWAFPYVEHAKPYLTGYQSGATFTYKPNDNAVREDIAVALVRLLKYDTSKTADFNILSNFRDQDEISTNLRPFIATAVATKLITGYDDRTFRPQAQLTRAEAASLIYRTKFDDETKVVFPPDQATPTNPKTYTITDDFSDSKLKKWDLENATGNWKTTDKQVTASSSDKNLQHYLLPVKWNENQKVTQYEVEITVRPEDTDGLGGLFFNGDRDHDEADLIYFTEDSVNISHMKGSTKSSTSAITSIDYNLKSKNLLKLVVVDKALYLYLNDQNIYSNPNYNATGQTLGLYLNKNAANKKNQATWFDDFSFKYVK